MRKWQKQLTLMMASGSIALIATISTTLSARQARTAGARSGGTTSAATPARELASAYCVGCHNDRVKTANLSLEKADAEQVFNSARDLGKSRGEASEPLDAASECATAGQRDRTTAWRPGLKMSWIAPLRPM